MRELLRTNDPVLLSFIEALLNEQSVIHFALDANMSVMEGSIGAIPRRIMVEDEAFERAKRILREAGLAAELGEA